MAFPVPAVTDETRAFWTGGAERRLMISRCGTCGFLTHPPVPRCPACLSEDIAPSPVSGRGRVYSFTINRQQWNPEIDVPYVIAVVALEEQPSVRLLTNVVGCAVEEVAIGMPVEVDFVARGEVHIPVFRPAGA
jgi:uncharacterized OB-fold protein